MTTAAETKLANDPEHRQTGEGTRGRISLRMFGANGTAWFDDVELREGRAITGDVFARRFTRRPVELTLWRAARYWVEKAQPILACLLIGRR